jgi:hypothetical protein
MVTKISKKLTIRLPDEFSNRLAGFHEKERLNKKVTVAVAPIDSSDILQIFLHSKGGGGGHPD